ncbi:LPS export ABC transporter permease LptF [Psychromarinibacter sp. C21-152]|uniref:LPS export ABC transporter permease LptF n=1 Tax=Psychromarinibacter sediminicola TaxID=3033385 RepID=A0AAE3NP23_9RHOB|nr:LPS export ABC transporter permease LptF [Psychromarinibacter sediminicola]MDF0600883.1 LPS export ABC transporter permease LptF [Psychromarinibacter sediminicola]
MSRFDRYILSQLMMLFSFFALVLVLIYWINRAVVLFDQLIANGQSAAVFFEFTALTLPNVIRIVLPIAAFAAAVYLGNRLTTESELVVVQATGFSPWRMVRPVLVFGVIVGLLIAILTNLLVPLSYIRLNERTAEISENITARLLTEGQFLHPADGVTFYIREITPQGELQDIFLSDRRSDSEHVTYTARQALLLRREDGPKLVMFDGMAQALNQDSGRLATTTFADFAYDISGFVEGFQPEGRSYRELTTAEMLRPTPETVAETGESASELMYEGHDRIAQALSAVLTSLIGFSAMLIGNFSRFGRWRQIVGALVSLAVLQSLDNAFADIARSDTALWPLTYGAAVLGLLLSLGILWVSARPALFARRRPPPMGVPA